MLTWLFAGLGFTKKKYGLSVVSFHQDFKVRSLVHNHNSQSTETHSWILDIFLTAQNQLSGENCTGRESMATSDYSNGRWHTMYEMAGY